MNGIFFDPQDVQRIPYVVTGNLVSDRAIKWLENEQLSAPPTKSRFFSGSITSTHTSNTLSILAVTSVTTSIATMEKSNIQIHSLDAS